MATTTVKYSVLASRVRAGLPDRYTGQWANPVGNANRPTRETAPLYANAPARVQNPKLNTKPWSTSFAVKRKSMPAKTSKKMSKHG